jgi:hypothetical protein
VTSEIVLLALLVFALVATRLWEEGRWRSGRMSDRTAAALLVGRLPFLLLGFTLITGQEPVAVLVATGLAALVGAALYPITVRRLRRSAATSVRTRG